jgi:hypothetical protein
MCDGSHPVKGYSDGVQRAGGSPLTDALAVLNSVAAVGLLHARPAYFMRGRLTPWMQSWLR